MYKCKYMFLLSNKVCYYQTLCSILLITLVKYILQPLQDYVTVLIKFKYCINTRKIFVKRCLIKVRILSRYRSCLVSINCQRNHKSRHRTNKKEIKFYVARQCINFITFSKFKGIEQIQASLIYVYIKQRVLRVGEARESGGRAKRFSLRSGSRGSSIDGATFVAAIVDANNVFTNNRETKSNSTRSSIVLRSMKTDTSTFL